LVQFGDRVSNHVYRGEPVGFKVYRFGPRAPRSFQLNLKVSPASPSKELGLSGEGLSKIYVRAADSG